ncbi:tRNA (guanosine(18)-2'-O)-methyltransferase [Porphyridium purpureum]|uniref:tRNA (Guanosine(18)-2'-O)-methyltransferase n=1 Tax=Porphyridium purpureum TaxID=35688 RepID=A0A5J4ZA70_PORPP|nr:tRNA (guanosine(18)-2'-O)-methyltransferase [Porphyridium purpureum]|eukprot:POR7417..scf295_1
MEQPEGEEDGLERRGDLASAGTSAHEDEKLDLFPYGRNEVLDVLVPHVTRERVKRLQGVIKQKCGSVHVLLENLESVNNGAAVLRSCDGMGLLNVHIVEQYDQNRRAFSSSISKSTDKWLTLRRGDDSERALQELKRESFYILTVFSREVGGKTVPLDAIDLPAGPGRKICVVFGNETRGPSKVFQIGADAMVHLPNVGFTPERDLSTTVAIALYYLRFRGQLTPDLTNDDELQVLYTRWIYQSAKDADELLKAANLEYAP